MQHFKESHYLWNTFWQLWCWWYNHDVDGDITTTIIPVTTMTMIFHSVCLYSDFSAESHYEAGTPSSRLRSHLLILSAQVRMIIITIKKLIWGWYHYYMRMMSLFFITIIVLMIMGEDYIDDSGDDDTRVLRERRWCQSLVEEEGGNCLLLL